MVQFFEGWKSIVEGLQRFEKNYPGVTLELDCFLQKLDSWEKSELSKRPKENHGLLHLRCPKYIGSIGNKNNNHTREDCFTPYLWLDQSEQGLKGGSYGTKNEFENYRADLLNKFPWLCSARMLCNAC